MMNSTQTILDSEKISFRNLLKAYTKTSKPFARAKQRTHPRPKQRYNCPLISSYGNTWDVKHLDSFLRYCPSADSNLSTTKNLKHIHQSQQINSNQFFPTQAKFDSKAKQLAQKRTDFKGEYSNQNYFAISKTNLLAAKKYYQMPQEFEKSSKKLDMYTQHIKDCERSFMNPKKQRQILCLNKKIIEEKSKIKSFKNMQIKKDRILKNAFKSGILQIDNPTIQDTFLFKDQKQRNSKTQTKKKPKQITNQLIDPKRIFDQTERSYNQRIVPYWKCKKMIQTIYKTNIQKSRQHIFGNINQQGKITTQAPREIKHFRQCQPTPLNQKRKYNVLTYGIDN